MMQLTLKRLNLSAPVRIHYGSILLQLKDVKSQSNQVRQVTFWQ